MKHSKIQMQQIYTDLEEEHNIEKSNLLKMKIIETWVKEYSNDADLGAKIREFTNLDKTK
tara:strand:+ start:237 stop:416 length:180 start_codon:yes stop_codon:yes gene_type:complete